MFTHRAITNRLLRREHLRRFRSPRGEKKNKNKTTTKSLDEIFKTKTTQVVAVKVLHFVSQPLERILVPSLLSALKHQVDNLSQHVRQHSSKRALAAELIHLPFLPLDPNYCMKLRAKFSSN